MLFLLKTNSETVEDYLMHEKAWSYLKGTVPVKVHVLLRKINQRQAATQSCRECHHVDSSPAPTTHAIPTPVSNAPFDAPEESLWRQISWPAGEWDVFSQPRKPLYKQASGTQGSGIGWNLEVNLVDKSIVDKLDSMRARYWASARMGLAARPLACHLHAFIFNI